MPVEFSEAKGVRWKTAIHDEGWSSPVVWKEQIWLTTARKDGKELFAVCVDLASGKVMHDIKVFDVAEPQKPEGALNSYASSTPFVEDGFVYLHFGAHGTACLDTKMGKTVWERRDLKCDHRVQAGSSPVVDGDSLFLTFDGVDTQFVVALEKKTGKTLWRVDRGLKSDLAETLKAQGLTPDSIEKTVKNKPGDNRKAYATPSVIEHDGVRQLVSPGAEATFAYDPKSGKELWRVRHPGMGWNVASRPLYAHGLVFLTSGFSKHALAVRPSGSGDVTETHVVWTTNKGIPSISSPLVSGDLMFVVSDEGIASCVESKTGKEVWKERLRGRTYWASPVLADGKIFYFSRDGKAQVVAAKRDFEVLAENKLDAEVIASPAVTGEAILLRSTTHLYCLARDGGAAKSEPKDKKAPDKQQTAPEASDKDKAELEALGKKLKRAVADGTMTAEEAKAEFLKAVLSSTCADSQGPFCCFFADLSRKQAVLGLL